MKFRKPKWAIKQIVRPRYGDKGNHLVEDICKHGCGHPNKEWLKEFGEPVDEIHGCCGCCSIKQKDNKK